MKAWFPDYFLSWKRFSFLGIFPFPESVLILLIFPCGVKQWYFSPTSLPSLTGFQELLSWGQSGPMELGSDRRRDRRLTRPRTVVQLALRLWSLCLLWSVGWSGRGEAWINIVCWAWGTLPGKARMLLIVFTSHFHFFSVEIVICCEFLKLRNYVMEYLAFLLSARMGSLCWNRYNSVMCPSLLPLPIPVHHLEPSSAFRTDKKKNPLSSRYQWNVKSQLRTTNE